MRPPESFVEQPVRSLQTMLRIIAEDDISLPTVIPDGIYGPSTMSAVSAFQRKYGLPITGITDQLTWDSIVSVYDPAATRIQKAQPIEILLDAGEVLRLGESNPYVYLAQAMLIQLSENHAAITPPEVSGIIDTETSNALLQFQRLSGLDATGEMDRITWKHLVLQFTLDAHHRNTNYSKL